jgi:hypothetical protein
MANQYILGIDWNLDTVFTDEGGRLTDFSISRGRRTELSGNEYTYIDPGTLNATVDDYDGRYNPFNTTSALVGTILPNRPIKLQAVSGGTTYTLFQGWIKDIIPQSERGIARIEASDGLEKLQNQSPSPNVLKTTYKVSDAISDLLTDAAWPGFTSTTIEDNGTTMPYWWTLTEDTVWDNVKNLSEAFSGDPFISSDGKFKYHARSYSGVPIYTISESEMLKDIQTPQPWLEVRNDIKVSAYPRVATGTVEIWRLTEAPYIEPGDTLTIFANYVDPTSGASAPALSVIAPVQSTDYTAGTTPTGNGEEDHISVDPTYYATQTQLAITNNSTTTGLYISLFKLRGVLFTAYNKSVSTTTDTTSIAAYGRLSLEIDQPWIQETSVAQDHATYAKMMFADPRKIVWIKIQERPTYQFGVDLFDLVTLSMSKLQISGDYKVTYIQHDWVSGQPCTTTLRLEPTTSIAGAFWVFTTILGVTSRLGW